MKQSQNAIKYLMAQYRSIFKQAFFKGLTGAIVLSAGLAAFSTASAAETTEGPLVFESGSYSADTETQSILKDGSAIEKGDLITADGKAIVYDTGSIALQGQITLKNTTFEVPSDGEGANQGARVTFDNTNAELASGGYFNVVNFSGTNTFSDQVTIHSKTLFNNAGSGNMVVYGPLTISKDAKDSDLSAIDIQLKMPTSGENEGISEFVIDPDITVGNMFFASGSHINLYTDGLNPEEGADANTQGRTITVAANKTITFESGDHLLFTNIEPTEEQTITPADFSLEFAGSSSTKVVNNGALGIQRPTYFSNGISLNNYGTINTDSGAVGNRVEKIGNLTINSGSTFNNNAGASLSIANGTTVSLEGGSKFNNQGTVSVAAGGAFTIAGDTVNAYYSTVIDDTTFKIVNLASALGSNFTSSGTITLTQGASATEDYTFDTDLSTLKKLGIALDGTNSVATSKLVLEKISLRVDGDASLSTTMMEHFSGDKAGSDQDEDAPELQILGDLTFTTTTSATGEALNGVTLVGMEGITFKSGKTDATKEPTSGSILVSGSTASSDDTIFVACGNVDSASGESLTFKTSELHLDNYNFEEGALNGSVDVNLIFDSGSKLEVHESYWTAQDLTFQNGGSLYVTSDSELYTTSLDAKNISATGSTSLRVVNAALTADTLKLDGASATFEASGGASVSIDGDGKSDTVDFKGSSIAIKNSSLDLNNVADTIGMTYTSGDGFAASNDFSLFGAENADIYINIDSVTGASGNVTIDEANSLLGILTGGTGLIHLTGSVGPTIDSNFDEDLQENVVSFDDLVDEDGNLNLTFDTETTREAVLTGVDTNKTISGGWKAVQTKGSGSNATVAANGTLAVYGANNGNFAQDESGSVVGLTLSSGSTVKFNNEGKVGAITGSGSVNFVAGSAVSVVAKDGTAGNIDVTTILGAGGVVAKDIDADSINMNAGSTVSSENLTSTKTDFSGSKVNVNNEAVLGTASLSDTSLTAKTLEATSLALDQNTTVSGESITADNISLTGNSSVIADTIQLDINTGILQVGTDKTATSAGGTAKVRVGRLNLGGGMLVVDPEFSQQTATVYAKAISKTEVSDTAQMDVNGHLVVGKNSALGIGGDEESFNASLAKYQTNGSLDQYGAYVYVNRANINLNGNKLVIGAEDVDSLKAYAQGNARAASSGNIYFGTDSALHVSAKALNEAAANQTTVIADKSSQANLVVDSIKKSGTIIIPANTSAEQFAKIFGEKAELLDGSVLTAMTENGLQSAVINTDDLLQGKGFKLTLSTSAYDILSDLSAPTYEYVLNVLSDESASYVDEKAFDAAVKADEQNQTKTAYGTNGVAIIEDSYGYQFFIQDALASADNHHIVEQGARLAAFGGAVQAAQNASNSTSDAISGRLGMGNSAARLTVADNAQATALWVAPVYKNFSSDSFDANGLSYGADVDLYGAALGVDYTLANGIRVGGMFNVGSGDADGNGAGAGVTNDFSYYGFGLYAGFTPVENLTLTADISYTILDNDLEASHTMQNYGKLEASTDSTALSVGVGAQYVLKSSVDITPHIGLRYTNLDIDDYDVKVDGYTVASTKGDTAGVFSIPVGVSLSKDITASSWVVRPAADFTVAMNFGDDEIDSTTAIDGVLGDEIKTTSEFGDSITYGVAFGVSAKSGNLSFGVNAGYNKSSNTDDYSVGANARFAF